MNLEPIIHSEVSQRRKDKYHILTHIYVESRKIVLKILRAGQQRTHRHFGHGRGRRGVDDLGK